jgi:hypothetical protein
MAQLSPRVADNDPILGRANTFYTQLDRAQTVPPAVQNVYNSDISGLNPDQQHEVLLMLSSLNECPGLSAALQQSVLDAFDQLTPQTVADPNTSTATSASSDQSSAGQVVVVRSDNTTVDDSSSTGHVWWDGEWNGHPWWFRPTWDHPVTDTADWVQWGTDRRAGIVWRWHDNDWQRIGRPTDDPANRPWLPTVIGPGRLDHDPATVPLNHQPGTAPGSTQFPMPGQPQVPPVAPQATASAQPDVTTPQQITRPDFRDSRPDNTTGQPGATAGEPSSSAPTPAPKPDEQSARSSNGVGSGSTTDTTRGKTSSTTSGSGSSTTGDNRTTESRTDTNDSTASTPTPAPKPDRTDNTRDHSDRAGDNSSGSDSVGVQGGATNSTDNHRNTGAQS